MTSPPKQTMRTRLLIISDTHNSTPPFSLPPADILLHAGDLTMTGRLWELQQTYNWIASHESQLKLIIAGNHDQSLHREFYEENWKIRHRYTGKEDVEAARRIWDEGNEKKVKGGRGRVVYLEEGVRRFRISGGRVFTVYSSPYQPEFYNWAFGYPRSEDRYNPNPPSPSPPPENPVPDHPAIDIMLTHGPPKTILDETEHNEAVGCEHLLRAVQRAKPRLHVFGHIHESRGAKIVDWGGESKVKDLIERKDGTEDGKQSYIYIDLTNGRLEFGQQTAFVNACLMDITYNPVNRPFLVDLELPVEDEKGGASD